MDPFLGLLFGLTIIIAGAEWSRRSWAAMGHPFAALAMLLVEPYGVYVAVRHYLGLPVALLALVVAIVWVGVRILKRDRQALYTIQALAARLRGRFGDALRWYALAGDKKAVRDLLMIMGGDNIALAIGDIIDLRASLLDAKRSGVSPTLLGPLEETSVITLDILVQSAVTLKAIADRDRRAPVSQSVIDVEFREQENVGRIRTAIAEAREGLAELATTETTLKAGDRTAEIANIERQFRRLTYTAQAMDDVLADTENGRMTPTDSRSLSSARDDIHKREY